MTNDTVIGLLIGMVIFLTFALWWLRVRIDALEKKLAYWLERLVK